ncbi:MAG: YHS domain-containing protein [Phycisphaeraceae bacterium]|nr:YHS domain-containing protein [Phycisphaeraceae bacterium]
MKVSPGNAADRFEHDGTEHLFCSTSCAEKFRADPARYLENQDEGADHGDHSCSDHEAKADSAARREGSKDAIYTCPMHPEVRQVGPGDCPKCGMALEPVDATAEQDDTELRDMTRRFWIATAFTAPLLVHVMGNMLFGHVFESWIGPAAGQWAELALATPVVLWCAWPFFVRGARSIRTVQPNMWTLISIGVAIAYVFSVIATIASGLFPEALRGDDGRVGVYFEAAAAIVTLVLLGQVKELRARRQTGGASANSSNSHRECG